MSARYELGPHNRHAGYAQPVTVIADSYSDAQTKALTLSGWGRNGKTWFIKVEAAAPFIAAQATALIADLLDPDPCSFDHNHSCQAHGYYYLKQDEACPQHDAKEWVKAYLRSGT